MKIKIQYGQLINSINFLNGLNLKGKKAIHRTRFENLLRERFKQVSEEEMTLVKEFAGVILKDGREVPKTKESGGYDIQDEQGFREQQDELFAEYYVIEGGDAHGMLKTMKSVIESYDGEVSGADGTAFEHLYTAFEQANENEQPEGEDDNDGKA